MSAPRKIILPLIVLALGGAATVGLVAASPKLETAKPQHRAPSVATVRAELASVTLRVRTQGTVVPRTESDLVAEVSGRIIAVSPSLASGGFLEQGEAIVTIDPSDYEIAVERAKALVARAKSLLALTHSALERQENLSARRVGSSADLDSARSNEQVAEAEVRDTLAALARSELDLERTKVRVPFAGRVRSKYVDIGQYVNRGAPVARVYAVDYAEVRLPIPDSDAAFVDLPIDYRNAERDDTRRPGDTQAQPGDAAEAPGLPPVRGPTVLLHASFAGREYTWQGRIVRTEGELDPKTRMIHAVARVEDPYGVSDEPGRPPLAVGLYVEAEIIGRELRDVVRVPRAALRGKNEIAVVTDDGRIDLRKVEVIHRDRDHVLIAHGLRPSENVIAGPLAVAVDGMQVRPFEKPSSETETVAAARGVAPRSTGKRSEERDMSAPGEMGLVAPGADILAVAEDTTQHVAGGRL